MARFIISTDVQKAKNAGYKAKKDIINILSDFTPLYIPSKMRIFNTINYLTVGMKKLIQPIRENDEVIVQFPIEGFYSLSILWMEELYRQLVSKKAKIITLVHDLDGLRYENEKKKQNDISILNQSTTIIVHSEEMKQWLKESGIIRPMVVLELFDYLSDAKMVSAEKMKKKIVFAGNLNKSPFLKREISFDLDVFGPCCFVEELPDNVHYCGSLNPNKLTKYIENYAFGLVWDGESLNEITGNTGRYLKYNVPHKFSLYLASGLPVITWKEAAIAKIIKKYDLGIVVSSLNEVPGKLHQLTEERYGEIRENVCVIQNKILAGEYIKEALRKVNKVNIHDSI